MKFLIEKNILQTNTRPKHYYPPVRPAEPPREQGHKITTTWYQNLVTINITGDNFFVRLADITKIKDGLLIKANVPLELRKFFSFVYKGPITRDRKFPVSSSIIINIDIIKEVALLKESEKKKGLNLTKLLTDLLDEYFVVNLKEAILYNHITREPHPQNTVDIIKQIRSNFYKEKAQLDKEFKNSQRYNNDFLILKFFAGRETRSCPELSGAREAPLAIIKLPAAAEKAVKLLNASYRIPPNISQYFRRQYNSTHLENKPNPELAEVKLSTHKGGGPSI